MIRMGKLKYTMRLYERDTLYDLDLDPHEQVNRIDDPAYAEKVAEMRERMLAWYQETADWVPNRKTCVSTVVKRGRCQETCPHHRFP